MRLVILAIFMMIAVAMATSKEMCIAWKQTEVGITKIGEKNRGKSEFELRNFRFGFCIINTNLLRQF